MTLQSYLFQFWRCKQYQKCSHFSGLWSTYNPSERNAVCRLDNLIPPGFLVSPYIMISNPECITNHYLSMQNEQQILLNLTLDKQLWWFCDTFRVTNNSRLTCSPPLALLPTNFFKTFFIGSHLLPRVLMQI